jgi:hypothetical protein
MKFMVADVFADPARERFPGTTGNRAGVVWLQESVTFPSDIYMARLAARYGYQKLFLFLRVGLQRTGCAISHRLMKWIFADTPHWPPLSY